MVASTTMLRTTEAAAVSRVDVRDVNRVIDEGILPNELFTADDGRYVTPAACVFISFYFAAAAHLTSHERLHIIRSAEPRLRNWTTRKLVDLFAEEWTIRHEFLTIDFAPFGRPVAERLARLEEAHTRVEISDEVLGGAPVVRGTRIPVHDIAASVAAGHSTARIIAAYPGLDAETIELAAIYAEANPLRGRPRVPRKLPKGAVVIADRRVPRHRKAE
jgi:uncharacterized protein (DUF433 family)